MSISAKKHYHTKPFFYYYPIYSNIALIMGYFYLNNQNLIANSPEAV
jgi:hypothetical protein